MEITSKRIPHKYRNKYLKNVGSAILDIGNNGNFTKQETSDVLYTRSLQMGTTIIELQTQINELKERINELSNASGGTGVEDPTGGGGTGVEDPTA